MPRDPNRRPGGSPRKRERRAALERGEYVPGASRVDRDRKTKCTPELTQRVVLFVRAGNFIETACAAAGIARNTMRAWLDQGAHELDRIERGEEPDEDAAIFLAFHREVTQAYAEAEAHDVAAISRAGRDYEHTTLEYEPVDVIGEDGTKTKALQVARKVVKTERGDARALMWRLEHMHGDKYSQRVKVEVEGQLMSALDFLEQNIPPESYRHVIEALAKWAGSSAS